MFKLAGPFVIYCHLSQYYQIGNRELPDFPGPPSVPVEGQDNKNSKDNKS